MTKTIIKITENKIQDLTLLIRQDLTLVIDDFVVPGHPDCRFDKYRGIACDWEYIMDLFEGRDVSVYYPTRPNRDFRGWGLIVSGYTLEELAFLDKLPLFKPLRSSGLFQAVRSILAARSGHKRKKFF